MEPNNIKNCSSLNKFQFLGMKDSFRLRKTSFLRNKADNVRWLKSLFSGLNHQETKCLQTFFMFSFLPKLSNK